MLPKETLPHLDIRNSSISGNGVFATRKIPANTLIHKLSGVELSIHDIIERIRMGAESAFDPLAIGHEVYLDLDELSRSFNHSCEPNSYIHGRDELFAIRDIEPGEEITYDYSTTMEEEYEPNLGIPRDIWLMTVPCNCGAASCRGIIDQFRTLPRERQRFYITHGYMPDFMLHKFRNS